MCQNSNAISFVVTTVLGDSTSSFSYHAYCQDGPLSQSAIYRPFALTRDSQGNIYISDTMNNNIRKISIRTGIVSTFAGPACSNGASSTTGRADGKGTNAKFFAPKGIAIDSTGNIYVADEFNSIIRKITPDKAFAIKIYFPCVFNLNNIPK